MKRKEGRNFPTSPLPGMISPPLFKTPCHFPLNLFTLLPRYDYLEFTDSNGVKKKFDQKVGTEKWPTVSHTHDKEKLFSARYFLMQMEGLNIFQKLINNS